MKIISKKFLCLLISVCMVVSMFPLAANAAKSMNWQYVGESGFSGEGAVTSPQMVMDSGGTPYVMYQANSKYYVKKFSGGTWQQVGNPISSLNVCTLAVNDSGIPYVALIAPAPEDFILSVYSAGADDWQWVESTTISGVTTPSICLAFNHENEPYVAYSTGSVVHWYNGAGGSLVNESYGGVMGTKVFGLAFNSDDTPYVSFGYYTRAGTGPYHAVVYECTGGGLSVGGTNYPTGNDYAPAVSQASFVIGSDNTLYLSYVNSDGKLYIKKCVPVEGKNALQWSWETVTERTDINGATSLSLVKDSSNPLYAAFSQYNNSAYSATVYKGSASSSGWSACTGTPAAKAVSIASDRDGTPYLAYVDENDKLRVKKYVQSTSCTVTYSEGEHGTLSGSATEDVSSGGSPQSIPAVNPASGYVFTGWSSDGGTTKYTAEQLKALPITSDLTFTAYYDSIFSFGGLWYAITGADTVKVVSATDETKYSGNVTIPAAVTLNNTTYNVTAVGDRAFNECSGLTSVIIPDSVTKIEDCAFEASGLTELNIPSHVTSIGTNAFYGILPITSVTVPSNVKFIGEDAFAACSSLTSVTIRDGVQEIGKDAFGYCEKLPGTIAIPASVTSIGAGAFQEDPITGFSVDSGNQNYCSVDGVLFSKDKTVLAAYPGGRSGSYSIPSGTKSVGENAFALCFYLTNVTIPSGVTFIGDGAFMQCTSLADVTIPSSVTSIGQGAFMMCTNFTSVTIPSGVTSIGDYTFAMSGLTNVTVPSGVTSIGQAAFAGCPALTQAVIKCPGLPKLPEAENGGISVFFMSGALEKVFVPQRTLEIYKARYVDLGVSSDFIFGMGSLSTPAGLNWSGTAAKWSAVENASGYTVRLYKDGAACGSAVTVDSSTLQYDFSAAITAAGSGTYTFTVIATSGNTNYGDSAVSSASAGYTPSPSGGSSSGSSSSGGSPATVNPAPSNETKVDASGNTSTVSTVAGSVTTAGDTAQISATVTNITTDTTGTNVALDTGKQAKVRIELPKDAVMQQLAAKKDVDLTITVPSEVAKDANSNVAVTIAASKDILAAAKASAADLTIKIKDADTQQLAYSWTFKGEDLAKSTAPVTDVNISMAVRLTTEVPQVNKVTPQNTGLVLMFDHSGSLPSTASVTFSAKEKGFQPGQTLYFYYYNPTTGQIEAQGRQYTVDADGNVTVQITHCSNYVLLPHSARTITLDTRTYTVNPGGSYVTGVKLTGVSGAKIKAYSSAKGVAAVTVLKNGNVKATGVKSGSTYIMIDVYDSKNKFLTHASVLLTVQKAAKPSGSSARQYGIF